MKECDILKGSKHTLTPPTYFQGVRTPNPPGSTQLNKGTTYLLTYFSRTRGVAHAKWPASPCSGVHIEQSYQIRHDNPLKAVEELLEIDPRVTVLCCFEVFADTLSTQCPSSIYSM